MTVLTMDLDGFKQVNDRFGHLAGNRLLLAIGAWTEVGVREYDFVARMAAMTSCW